MIIRDTGVQRTFELPPSGAFTARCYRIYDLGTQLFKVKGEQKQAHQVLVAWELSKLMSDGKPFTVRETYTASLHEKAKLRAILESWRGRKFTEAERKGFKIEQVLGQACFLNIVHTHKGEKTYANVAGVMPVPDGLPTAALFNEMQHFDMENWDEDIFLKIPKYYQEIIKRSPEFEEHAGNAVFEGERQQAVQDDDIPF